MPREAISPTLRFEVLRRCNFPPWATGTTCSVQFFEDEELPEDGLTDCYICNQVFWAGVDFARGKRERPVER
jgi:hypothetical protein